MTRCTRVAVFVVLTSCIAFFTSSTALASEAASEPVDNASETNPENPNTERPHNARPCKVSVYQNRRTRRPHTDHRGFFRISPGLGVPGVSGDVVFNGQVADIDARPGADRDPIINLAPGVGVEAGYCRTSVAADLQYLDMSTADVELDGADGEFDLEKFISHVTVNWTYELIDILQLGPVAGFRYVHVDTGVEVENEDLFAASASDGWLDPIVGIRGRVMPMDWLYLAYYGDAGGIGFGSEFSWQLYAGLGLAANGVDFELGYRHLFINYDGDDFDYEVHLGSPTLTTTFRF